MRKYCKRSCGYCKGSSWTRNKFLRKSDYLLWLRRKLWTISDTKWNVILQKLYIEIIITLNTNNSIMCFSAYCTGRDGKILGSWQVVSSSMAGMNCSKIIIHNDIYIAYYILFLIISNVNKQNWRILNPKKKEILR